MNYTINTLDQIKPILVGFRKSHGFSQKVLAEKLGISQQSYQVLESAPQNVTLERLYKVSFYFDNLLPDSQNIRERLARRFKTNSIQAFDLLIALGRDCVGAIQLLPEGEAPKNIKHIKYQYLDDSQVADILNSATNS